MSSTSTESSRSSEERGSLTASKDEIAEAPKHNQSPPTENEKLEHAVKFWTNPALANVPVAEKLSYLRAKQGMKDEDIHQLWERLLTVEQHRQSTREAAIRGMGAPNAHQPMQSTATTTANPPTVPTASHQYYNQGYPSTQYMPIHEQQQQQESGDDGAHVPALLAIGGFLGLAAAAGFRWLNGGDFTLFPPPTRHGQVTPKPNDEVTDTRSMEDQVAEGEEDVVYMEEDEDEDEFYETVDVEPSRLENQLERLVEAMRASNETHEALVQRLVGKSTKEVTDSSMNLLRRTPEQTQTNPDTVGLWLIFGKLVEIKHQLEIIQKNSDNNESLATVLQELSVCMSQLQRPETNLSSTIQTKVGQTIGSNDDGVQDGSNDGAEVGSNDDCSGALIVVPDDPVVAIDPAEKSPPETLRDVMETLARNNKDKASLKVGAQLLHLYIVNLCSNPHVSRYRKIFTNNESFRKVEKLDGAKELLLMVGFEQVSKSCLEWKPQDEEKSLERLKVVAAALSVLKSVSPSTTTDELVYIQKVVAPLLPLVEEEEAQASSVAKQQQEPLATPETNSLLSPPAPKRDLSLPAPSSFPETPVHTTTTVDEEQSAVRLFSSPTEQET